MNLQGRVYSRNPESKLDPLFRENWLGKLPVIEGKITAIWEDSSLGGLIRKLKNNHFLIIYEISDLGRHLREAVEILAAVFEFGAILYILSDNVFVASENKISIPGFSAGKRLPVMELCLRVSDMDAARHQGRTRDALLELKSKGKILGRPKGRRKSKLDADREEILKLRRVGCTLEYLSREYEVSIATMSYWLKWQL